MLFFPLLEAIHDTQFGEWMIITLRHSLYTYKYYKTVNIYKFSRDFIESYYLPFLQTFMDVFGKNNYYETCLKFLAQTDPTLLKAFQVPGDIWYEIDNPDDLKAAEKRF